MAGNFFEFQQKVTRKRRPTAPEAERGSGNAAAPPPGSEPLTVAQLTAMIDKALKAGLPAVVWVKGELSNYHLHEASGHLYFTLKDASSCIDCMMYRSDAERLKFTPEDGLEMLAGGRVQVYARKGRYQLYVTTLEPLGQGALELAFRQLYAKLEAEGLFEPERKRPLPAYPRRIALVTSSNTAALHDMLKVLRRFSWLKLFLYHVPVQGDGSGAKIAAALNHLNRHARSIGGLDIILLGRGGGSLEDLWAFNEEPVARAVAASPVPVVTGIGHEIDVSIADLVADYHAHTPTEAAQVVTTHWRLARDAVEMAGVRLRRALRGRVESARARLNAVERHEVFRRPLHRVQALRQVVDEYQKALSLAACECLRRRDRMLRDLACRLDLLGPTALLRRRRETLVALEARLASGSARRLRVGTDRLAALALRLTAADPRHRLQLAKARLDQSAQRLGRALDAKRTQFGLRVEALAAHLEAVNPHRVLQRGYSITTRRRDGRILRNAADVKPGDRIVTHLAEGEIGSTVEDARQLPLFE